MRDEQSYVAFVAGARRQLRSAAFLMTGSWERADDAVQDALVRVYVAWPRLRRVDAAHAYARRALASAVVDESRRPWRRERTGGEPPDRPGPDDGTGRVEDRDLLVAALQALPLRQRQVVVLRFLDDLSVEQTAAALGTSSGTVKSQCSRALATLRLTLGPELMGADAEGRRTHG